MIKSIFRNTRQTSALWDNIRGINFMQKTSMFYNTIAILHCSGDLSQKNMIRKMSGAVRVNKSKD